MILDVRGSLGVDGGQHTAADYQPARYQSPVDRAREYNVRARKAYDLGKFQKAVDLYTNAYDELPDGAFLFNIAQSYRQLDNCEQALVFYKRFLSIKKDVPAATGKEVLGHIVVLEQCVKKQGAIRPAKTKNGTPRLPSSGTANISHSQPSSLAS